jgi:acetyltransferase-like isoleucine patch superfamily enzyme
VIQTFLLKVRRAETPFYRRLKRTAHVMRSARLPLPDVMLPVMRLGFYAQHSMKHTFYWFWNRFYREPLFRGRCTSLGKDFKLYRLPFILGHAEIHIGDDVTFYGQVDIFSGRIFDHPKLILGDRVELGHGVSFVVNKEIVVEEDANISSGVRIMDTDSHPRDAEARIADLPPSIDEVKPVRICRYAWIGERAFIMKGVTIGEGAIVGVNSVVVNDVPAYSVAMGNPARVVLKGGLRPAVRSEEASSETMP